MLQVALSKVASCCISAVERPTPPALPVVSPAVPSCETSTSQKLLVTVVLLPARPISPPTLVAVRSLKVPTE